MIRKQCHRIRIPQHPSYLEQGGVAFSSNARNELHAGEASPLCRAIFPSVKGLEGSRDGQYECRQDLDMFLFHSRCVPLNSFVISIILRVD